jgi:hypothetical protein
MIWTGRVARMGRTEKRAEFNLGNLQKLHQMKEAWTERI